MPESSEVTTNTPEIESKPITASIDSVRKEYKGLKIRIFLSAITALDIAGLLLILLYLFWSWGATGVGLLATGLAGYALFVWIIMPLGIVNAFTMLIFRPSGVHKIISYVFLFIFLILSIFPVISLIRGEFQERQDESDYKKRIETISGDEAIRLINECRVEEIRFDASDSLGDSNVSSLLTRNEESEQYYLDYKFSQKDFKAVKAVAEQAEEKCGEGIIVIE